VTELRFFEYIEPFWSVGDRYVLSLDFPDELILRAELASLGLGLEAAGDVKIGGQWIDVACLPLYVTAFGPTITLSIGPDDRYEHCDGRHRAQAYTIDDALATHGLEKRVVRIDETERSARWEFEDWSPANFADYDAGAKTRPKPDRAKRREARIVEVIEKTASGARLRTLASSIEWRAVDEMEVTSETECVASAAPFARDALEAGMIATAKLGTGKRADGAFGAIATRLELFLPDATLLATTTAWSSALEPMGINIDAARFAALFMIERAERGTRSIDEACAAELEKARLGRKQSWFASASEIVTSTLLVLKRLGLPCLFNARLRVTETDLPSLFHQTIDHVNAAADAAGEQRRWRAVTLRGTSEEVWLQLTEQERTTLAATRLAK
jgi:hypothetical protein